MKNIRLAGLVLMVGVLLTSCLGESGHKIQLLAQPAVYVSDSVGYFLLKGGELVRTNLSNTEDMDCFIVNLDIDLYENEEGVYEADLVSYAKLEKWNAIAELTDTTEFFETERFFSTLNEREACILNQFFLVSTHNVVDSTEINNKYNLSFIPYQKGEYNSEVDATVYQLYLRAYEEKAGSKVTDISKARRETNVFNMQSFYDTFSSIEKEKDTPEIYFKIRYGKSFNTDTTAINWADSPIYSIPLTR